MDPRGRCGDHAIVCFGRRRRAVRQGSRSRGDRASGQDARRYTTYETHAGRQHTRPARQPVDRGPLARRASNDSNDPRRARRPRSTARETTAATASTLDRLANLWTAGLWPAVPQRLERPKAGETPAVHRTRDDRRPPAHSTGSPTCGPRASGPPCAQRLERPKAGETPAVHRTRDDREAASTLDRLANLWTAGLWPAVRQRLDRPKAGETPAVHRTRDDRRPPAHSTGSPTSGPRASGPPCDQRLARPEAGETPAVHRTRDDRGPPPRDARRLANLWTAGLWPAVRSTTRTTQGGRDAASHHTRDDREPPNVSHRVARLDHPALADSNRPLVHRPPVRPSPEPPMPAPVRRVVLKVSGESFGRPGELGIDPHELAAMARDRLGGRDRTRSRSSAAVATSSAARRWRRPARSTSRPPTTWACSARSSTAWPCRKRSSRRLRDAGDVGDRHRRGRRAVHPPPGAAAPREGPRGDPRGGHGQSVLHHRHLRRACGRSSSAPRSCSRRPRSTASTRPIRARTPRRRACETLSFHEALEKQLGVMDLHRDDDVHGARPADPRLRLPLCGQHPPRGLGEAIGTLVRFRHARGDRGTLLIPRRTALLIARRRAYNLFQRIQIGLKLGLIKYFLYIHWKNYYCVCNYW